MKDNRKENVELCKRIQAGDKAAETELYNNNIGLVYKVIDKYIKYGEIYDYVQAGSIGLLEAAKRYDPERAEFSTYATYWITKEVLSEIRKGNQLISFSRDKLDKIYAVVKAEKELMHARLDEDEVIARIAKNTGLNIDEVYECQRLYRDYVQYVSLNEKLGDRDGTELQDISVGEHKLMEDIVIDSTLRENLLKLLEILDEKPRNILILRYGMLDDEPMDYSVIATLYGDSRQNIKQMADRAIAKLKASDQAYLLKDYYEDLPE